MKRKPITTKSCLLACRLRETLLRTALKQSMTALDDWLHLYAREQYDFHSGASSEQRIREAGGLLAYLARVQAANRAALGVKRRK